MRPARLRRQGDSGGVASKHPKSRGWKAIAIVADPAVDTATKPPAQRDRTSRLGVTMVDPRWTNKKLMKRLRNAADFSEVRRAFDNYEISTIQFRNLLRLKQSRESASDAVANGTRSAGGGQRLRRL